MTQRDTLHRPYHNHQRLESQKAVQTPEEREARIRDNQATIQTIEEQLNQKKNNLIPSGSQGVNQPDFQVALHNSSTRRSVPKSHYFSQFLVFSRRGQG
ncbi:hypothetical protein O181_095805 [Austropuccinia psidii MF-1]|uniref:Uncharacterized protein n=1 Tax=Austropuccinia psidii MF-1 TaxID=1389203 RepID=A0A9Q3J6F1_9BASI|nr:hypothetical protein [Austropuccinia psidii MF-1]